MKDKSSDFIQWIWCQKIDRILQSGRTPIEIGARPNKAILRQAQNDFNRLIIKELDVRLSLSKPDFNRLIIKELHVRLSLSKPDFNRLIIKELDVR
ncbi:MAG: hypothetical protein WED33_11490, partial [Bacteroidia bacterium]